MSSNAKQNNQTVSDLTVYCTKNDCEFYLDWDGTTPDHALKWYREYNEKHHERMKCVHNYATRERTDRRERLA